MACRKVRTVVGGFRAEVQVALVDNVITANEAERMRSLRLVASLFCLPRRGYSDTCVGKVCGFVTQLSVFRVSNGV